MALKDGQEGSIRLLAATLLAPAFEDAHPGADGAWDGRAQEAGLADSRLAGDHQQGWARPDQMAHQQGQLALPSNERRGGSRPRPLLLAAGGAHAPVPPRRQEDCTLVGRQGKRHRQQLQGVPARRMCCPPLHGRDATPAQVGALRQLLLREPRRRTVMAQQCAEPVPRPLRHPCLHGDGWSSRSRA